MYVLNLRNIFDDILVEAKPMSVNETFSYEEKKNKQKKNVEKLLLCYCICK